MTTLRRFLLVLSLAVAGALLPSAEAKSKFKCSPIKILMTRAVSSKAVSSNGAWVGPKFPADNVNTANVLGALKYIMTETIDLNTGVQQCTRKNGVAYIDFYLWTVCQPANALWWFSNLKPDKYGDTPQYNYRGFGQYLTFDDGACNNDQQYCKYINGNQTADVPKLGNFIGWQDVSADPRNPTEGAYWYSFPGSCPEKSRSSGQKTATCMQQYPSGLCANGQVPDGINCTYSYQFLGEISLDGLVGIHDLGYSNYTEFCNAGNVEFERSDNYSFIRGLPFWSDPLNQTRNAERVEQVLQYYANATANPMNLAIPSIMQLNTMNPKCFCNFPQCNAQTPCRYDNSQTCVQCDPTMDSNCEVYNPSECPYGVPSSMDPVKLAKNSSSTSTKTGASTGPDNQSASGGGGGTQKTSNSLPSFSSSSVLYLSLVYIFVLAQLI